MSDPHHPPPPGAPWAGGSPSAYGAPPPGYGHGYGQGYGYGAPGPAPSNGLAVAALVLGIVGLLGCLVPILGWFASPFALAGVGLAIGGLARARTIGRGRGLAIGGLVTGVLGLLAVTAWTVLLVVGTKESAELYTEEGIFGCGPTRSALEGAIDDFRAAEGREPASEEDLIDGGFFSYVTSDFDIEIVDGGARVVDQPGGSC